MEIKGDRHLRQRMLSMFFKRPDLPMLIPKRIKQFMTEEGISVEQLFFSRYDQLFIQNITSQQVFFRVMDDLANMVKCKKGITSSSKNKANVFFEDDEFILYFLTLLFTPKEKQLLYHQFATNFEIKQEKNYFKADKKQQAKHDQSQGLQTLLYLFKSVFGIGTTEHTQMEIEEEQGQLW